MDFNQRRRMTVMGRCRLAYRLGAQLLSLRDEKQCSLSEKDSLLAEMYATRHEISHLRESDEDPERQDSLHAKFSPDLARARSQPSNSRVHITPLRARRVPNTSQSSVPQAPLPHPCAPRP